jgi:hypothetical protein
MVRGEKLKHMDAQAISDEIKDAFKDVPHPTRCSPFEDYSDEADRLDYLPDKTWLDIAADLRYLTSHSFSEFVYMSKECFLYFFPGYLLGSILHQFVFMDLVIDSMLRILGQRHAGSTAEELFWCLSDQLTPEQKKAVAHWLRLQLEWDKERRPDLYRAGTHTTFETAFEAWRGWA